MKRVNLNYLVLTSILLGIFTSCKKTDDLSEKIVGTWNSTEYWEDGMNFNDSNLTTIYDFKTCTGSECELIITYPLSEAGDFDLMSNSQTFNSDSTQVIMNYEYSIDVDNEKLTITSPSSGQSGTFDITSLTNNELILVDEIDGEQGDEGYYRFEKQ